VSEFVRAGSLAEIPDGELRGYELGFGKVVVARTATGLRALEDECPADGCALSDGRLSDEGELVCPCDGSRFDAETGEPVRGPAEDRVAIFAVRIEAGWIEVSAQDRGE
jgi:3-phenylpropionate/trans-cinnamate dioxygenase ferredoxin component